MKRQILFLLFGLFLFLNQVSGQNFKNKFNDLDSKKDTIAQFSLLEKWEKSDSNDPELYVAYFNFYVNKSRKEIIAMGKNPKGEDALKIMDQDSTKKEPVAFMYGDTYYNQDLLKKGFNYIDKGIKINPTRLDMRFGKIYMLGKIEDYETFTTEIINTIDYSAVINNQWTWADNKPYESGYKYFLGDIQSYVLQLYNTENDALLDNMKRIAEAALKHYPNHIESLTNVSIVHLLRKDYDKALEILLKAQMLDPKDAIVSSDIAQAYKLKGDSKNAIKYYEMAIENGDDQTKDYAKKQIEKLKN
jgi:tetratricopeptide (TPR) repeat protein